jgi:glycosyltransferase involved in cell wall biosynthesis
MTRIAIISEHASPIALLGSEDAGGQNVYVEEIARHLARLGHLVDIFTRRDSPDAAEVVEWAAGVRVIHVDAGAPRFLAKDELWPLMPAFRDAFSRFMRREGATYDLIHGNFWMSGWVADEVGRMFGIPVVQLFHALGTTKRRFQGAADTSPPDRIAVERGLVRQVDRVIATCPAEERILVGEYGADSARLTMIPLAVDTKRFRPMAQGDARRQIEAQIPRDGPLVVYVGRLLPRKDIRNVVRALALLNREIPAEAAPARLMIVGGDGRTPDPAATPEIGELSRLADDLGVRPFVHFTGKRQQEELRAYYAAGDVVVTTPWYEPFGLTPLEAMACGRPVIGSAVGGITFTVRDGETGLLVPPRDPAALAARLRDLLNDDSRRARMGDSARRRVERHFTWPSIASRTADLYASLVERERTATAAWRLVPARPHWQRQADELLPVGD